MKKFFLYLVFFAYVGVLLYLLLFGRTVEESAADLSFRELFSRYANLVPLRSVRSQIQAAQFYWENYGSDYYIRYAIKNIGGNLLLFVPLGCFLPILFKSLRNYLLFLLLIVLSVCLIEVIQLVSLLGSMDVDDLILNTIGATAGYLFWLACREKTPKPQ